MARLHPSSCTETVILREEAQRLKDRCVDILIVFKDPGLSEPGREDRLSYYVERLVEYVALQLSIYQALPGLTCCNLQKHMPNHQRDCVLVGAVAQTASA
jgi:hypothetical protein